MTELTIAFRNFANPPKNALLDYVHCVTELTTCNTGVGVTVNESV